MAAVRPGRSTHLREGARAVCVTDGPQDRALCPAGPYGDLCRAAPYLLSLPVFCVAVAIALSITFGNLAPVAAVCVIAIGLIERDGLVVLPGLRMSLIALAVTGAILSTAAGVIAWI